MCRPSARLPAHPAVVQYAKAIQEADRIPPGATWIGPRSGWVGGLPAVCLNLGSGAVRTLDLATQLVVMAWVYPQPFLVQETSPQPPEAAGPAGTHPVLRRDPKRRPGRGGSALWSPHLLRNRIQRTSPGTWIPMRMLAVRSS